MPLKGRGPPNLEVIDRFDDGVGWLAHPDEAMQRASHAVASDGETWVIDPVDAPDLDDLLAELPPVAGVVTGYDDHRRDAGAVATRHDVPVYVPSWMSGVADSIDAPVERFDDGLGAFAVEPLVDNPFWREAVLFDGETLVVPESLGTGPLFTAPGEALGVHPFRRALPPHALTEYDADRLLLGHGRGVFEDARAEVRRAVDGSRRRMVPLYLDTVRGFLGLR